MAAGPELTVRGESVEQIFRNFEGHRYLVNRRYQRKLIWTLDEKQNFIDSIRKGYPVPIILLAENTKRSSSAFEIIDGMQRLDAVVSFVSNKYPVDGRYFDLETTATTKALADGGKISQRFPVMDRETCVRIAAYLIPLSIYEFADEESVDMVFRRINSGGRQLSRQELRSAGATANFATVVRQVAAKVRGDDSYSDILRLNQMQEISITNKDLSYGINVDHLFWVEHGILSRDNVRQSRDEEIVADLVAYMVSPEPISSRSEFLDDFYGMGDQDDRPSRERFQQLDSAIKMRNADLVVTDFQRTLDEIKLALEHAKKRFVDLIFDKPQSPAPRYFQAAFLGLYQLIVRENQIVVDKEKLVESLRGIGDHITVQEGSNWGAENRQKAIDSVVGNLRKAFGLSQGGDPATVHWITQLQNLLTQSITEQSAYDFKQGFLLLDGKHGFDDASFQKILKTCVAISNIGKGQKGYIIVGVVESGITAARVEKLFGVSCLPFQRFKISGIEHEATAIGKSLDDFFKLIANKVTSSGISEPLRSYITNHLKLVKYYDKAVFVFEVVGQESPSLFDNGYFERSGPAIKEIQPADFPTFFERYNLPIHLR